MVEMIQANENRETAEWKRTRELLYTIYQVFTKEEDRVDIVEYMPLPGDVYDPQKKRKAMLARLAKGEL
ncbi:hypothetical protein KRR40_12650 [Niabella defluvii]|nr:hypothetical protein KRR40_12650 [Niabella sp. I65]